MPRALAEISHQLPDVTLIPFPVVSDRLRVEPWWSNGPTTRWSFLIFQIPVRSAHALRQRDARPKACSCRLAAPQTRPLIRATFASPYRHPRAFSSLQRAVLRQHDHSHDRGAADDLAALCVLARRLAWLCQQHPLVPTARVRHQGRMARTRKTPRRALIVACKHQSPWETFALFTLLPDPAYILKRELMWMPLFGWLATRRDDSGRSRPHAKALDSMTAAARREAARGRQIVIFPEGTRRPPGAAPYCGRRLPLRRAGCPAFRSRSIPDCSGRAAVLRHPGTVLVEVLDPIPPGLERREFLERLQNLNEEHPPVWSRKVSSQLTADCRPLSRSAIKCRSVSR